MARIIIEGKFLFKPLKELAKPPYFARAPSVSYSSAPRLAKAPSISDLPHSSLATGWRLVKAALVSNFAVSATTTFAIWMAIEKRVDVQSVLEKLHLPRPDRPQFNSHTEDHESDNSASFGNKKNRTAELAASKAASPLDLALLINKSLFPVRLPFAMALLCPVAKLVASNSKVLVQLTCLSITIRVDLLAALGMLWIIDSNQYAKKTDVKEESGSDGGSVSLEIIARQVLIKVLENLFKKDKGSGGSQLVVKDSKEESASSRGGAVSLEMPCQTKAMVDFAKEVEADAVFPASRGKGNGQGGISEDPLPKNAMNNKMLYPPFKPHALDEIYARLGISYVDMVKKLLAGMESGPVAAPSGMPIDPHQSDTDEWAEYNQADTDEWAESNQADVATMLEKSL